ncbi:MAG TPA: hypothetical protein VGZ32_02960 [Actinocrinis sp.]|jgi:hypothetical protein|nr:hypothetical protein [Actinocrinis sp.]HEV3169265.1 hypothetical protein [Actinocrinis sp.]
MSLDVAGQVEFQLGDDATPRSDSGIEVLGVRDEITLFVHGA